MDKTEKPLKVVFFTPHVGLWVHTLPEVYIAKSMQDLGHDVSMVTCGRAHTYCAVMTSRRLSPGVWQDEYKKLCNACVSGAKIISFSYGFPLTSLSELVSGGDKAELEAISDRAVSAKMLDTNYLGVSVGAVALYEFTLAHKKMSTDLTIEQWSEYRYYLYNSLVSLKAFSRYIEMHSPDVIFTFSPQYSNINSCMQYAILKGIQVFFMESGTNLSNRLGTMRVWDWAHHRLVNPALAYWDKTETNLVDSYSASLVVDHFEKLIGGKHFTVFSKEFSGFTDIGAKWKIKPDQKVLLMTLSSYDEAYAALLIDGFPERKVFSDVYRTQAEWLQATLAWVQGRSDLFLIIRVHPRDFPNKRENIRSEQSFFLEGLLSNVPENVHVNWPDEGISLYEIFEETDVILTGWSVTAMEGLILGIPVVTYDANLPSYPSDIHYTGRSQEEYFENIEVALLADWSFQNVLNGFRWLAFNYVTSTIDVSKRIGASEHQELNKVAKIWKRVRDKFYVIGYVLDLLDWRSAREGTKTIDLMLSSKLHALQPVKSKLKKNISVEEEETFVVRELARLHNLLYDGNRLPSDKMGLGYKIKKFLESNTKL